MSNALEFLLKFSADGTKAIDVIHNVDGAISEFAGNVTTVMGGAFSTVLGSITNLGSAVLGLAGAGGEFAEQKAAFDGLAESMGVSSKAIIESIQDISGNTIDMSAAMKLGGEALRTNLGPEQMQTVFAFAKKQSELTGDSFEGLASQMVQSMAKGRVAILGTFGIMTHEGMAAGEAIEQMRGKLDLFGKTSVNTNDFMTSLSVSFKDFQDKIGKVVNDLPLINKPLQYLAESARDFVRAFDTEFVSQGIQETSRVVSDFLGNADFQEWAGAAKEALFGLFDGFSGIFSLIVSGWSEVFSEMFGESYSFAQEVKDVMKGAGDYITGILSIKPNAEGVKQFAKAVVDGIAAAATFFTETYNSMMEAFNFIAFGAGKIGNAFIQAFSFVAQGWDKLESAFFEGISSVGIAFVGALEQAVSGVDSILGQLPEKVQKALGFEQGSLLKGARSEITGYFQGMADSAKQSGQETDKFWSDFRAGVEETTTGMSTAFDGYKLGSEKIGEAQAAINQKIDALKIGFGGLAEKAKTAAEVTEQAVTNTGKALKSSLAGIDLNPDITRLFAPLKKPTSIEGFETALKKIQQNFKDITTAEEKELKDRQELQIRYFEKIYGKNKDALNEVKDFQKQEREVLSETQKTREREFSEVCSRVRKEAQDTTELLKKKYKEEGEAAKAAIEYRYSDEERTFRRKQEEDREKFEKEVAEKREFVTSSGTLTKLKGLISPEDERALEEYRKKQLREFSRKQEDELIVFKREQSAKQKTEERAVDRKNEQAASAADVALSKNFSDLAKGRGQGKLIDLVNPPKPENAGDEAETAGSAFEDVVDDLDRERDAFAQRDQAENQADKETAATEISEQSVNELGDKISNSVSDALGTASKTRMYEWMDENGTWQFSDQPPAGDIPYKTRTAIDTLEKEKKASAELLDTFSKKQQDRVSQGTQTELLKKMVRQRDRSRNDELEFTLRLEPSGNVALDILLAALMNLAEVRARAEGTLTFSP